jgi:hypothetical protein
VLQGHIRAMTKVLGLDKKSELLPSELEIVFQPNKGPTRSETTRTPGVACANSVPSLLPC